MEEIAIAYGEENERRAIAAFERETGLTVIDRNYPCSFRVGNKTFYGRIDGRVVTEKEYAKIDESVVTEKENAKIDRCVVTEMEDAIVEAKCPISEPLSRYLQENEDGRLILSSSPPSPYYHQVQAYMYALNKEVCYFFDWRSGDRLDIVKVPKNMPFIENVLEKLEKYNGSLRRMKDIAYICDERYYKTQ